MIYCPVCRIPVSSRGWNSTDARYMLQVHIGNSHPDSPEAKKKYV